eukprot:Colp12_sorted_trinity150504_noHs@3004
MLSILAGSSRLVAALLVAVVIPLAAVVGDYGSMVQLASQFCAVYIITGLCPGILSDLAGLLQLPLFAFLITTDIAPFTYPFQFLLLFGPSLLLLLETCQMFNFAMGVSKGLANRIETHSSIVKTMIIMISLFGFGLGIYTFVTTLLSPGLAPVTASLCTLAICASASITAFSLYKEEGIICEPALLTLYMSYIVWRVGAGNAALIEVPLNESVTLGWRFTGIDPLFDAKDRVLKWLGALVSEAALRHLVPLSALAVTALSTQADHTSEDSQDSGRSFLAVVMTWLSGPLLVVLYTSLVASTLGLGVHPVAMDFVQVVMAAVFYVVYLVRGGSEK